MQTELQNGNAKAEEPVQAGTSFMVSEPAPILDAVAEERLKEELQNSKDNIQKIFAAFKKDERKI